MAAIHMIFTLEQENKTKYRVDLGDFVCEKGDIVFVALPPGAYTPESTDKMLNFIRKMFKPKSVTVVPSTPEDGVQIKVLREVYIYGPGNNLF